MSRGRPFHLTTTGSVGNAGQPITLSVINVNKAVAGGTATVYNGGSAAGTVVAVIALDTVNSFFMGDAFCDAGCWIVLSATADLTVVAS